MNKLEIFDNTLIKLVVRKGPNADRVNAVLAEGEPGYTVDTKRLFIGDGNTPGGVVTGNKLLGVYPDLLSNPQLPGVVGDISYNTSNNTLYYIQSGTGMSAGDWLPIATNISFTEFESLQTIVQTQSGDWNSTYTTVNALSSKITPAYTTVNTLSNNWNTAYNAITDVKYPMAIKVVDNLTLITGVDISTSPPVTVSEFYFPISGFKLTSIFFSALTADGGEAVNPPVDEDGFTFVIYKDEDVNEITQLEFLPGVNTDSETINPEITLNEGDFIFVNAFSGSAVMGTTSGINVWFRGYVTEPI